jgi:hypothetical protein
LKLSLTIRRRRFFGGSRQQEALLGIHRLTLTVFDNEPVEAAVNASVSAGYEVLSAAKAGPRWYLEVRGALAGLSQLAAADNVAFVEESGEFVLRNDITKWVIQTNTSGQTTIWSHGVRGENQIAGLIDSNVYKAHDQFRDSAGGNTPGPNHRKLVAYISSNGTTSGSTHGTHTAGTLAGDQEPNTGSTTRNGMAYKARIAFKRLNDVTTNNLYSSMQALYDAGARVFSNSWGDDGTTEYTSHCQQIDQFSYDHEDSMIAFAVTNTSTLKTPENAKSVLAVGASQQAPNQNSHGSGGTGPTIDGRRKPEVYAPGVGIYSAQSGTTSGYVSLTGTSMACPAVTGASALVRQYVSEGFLSSGAPSTRGFSPSGALLRAMLMNTSVDMTGIAGYPSNQEGWGRILLENTLWFVGETRKTMVWDVHNGEGLPDGGQQVYTFKVTSSATPLRITLSFTDVPAQVFAAFAPINNVDLEVTAPNGNTYLGNVFSGGQSSVGGAADAINSTEMVALNSPPTGIYVVRVRADVLSGKKQGYALVANGVVAAPITLMPGATPY